MMDSARNNSKIQTLSEICADLFSLIVYLRETRKFEPENLLYDRIIALFNAMERKAREANIAGSDVQDAKYALTALIDETIGWRSRLEYEFSGTTIAGERFFDILDRERGKGDDARNEVLEIYYLCLMLGFEGQYFIEPERLQEYIREFQKRLSGEGLGKLSPQGERPMEDIMPKHTGIPSWLPCAFTGACFLGGFVVFFVLNHNITGWVDKVVTQIQNYFR